MCPVKTAYKLTLCVMYISQKQCAPIRLLHLNETMRCDSTSRLLHLNETMRSDSTLSDAPLRSSNGITKPSTGNIHFKANFYLQNCRIHFAILLEGFTEANLA